ncbi:DUF7134 domain-containing protein [Streptomyces sp. NPDC001070]
MPLQAGLLLPLLWRRKRSAPAFAAVMAVFVVRWALGAALRTDVALPVALYSLPRPSAADGPTRRGRPRGSGRPWPRCHAFGRLA